MQLTSQKNKSLGEKPVSIVIFKETENKIIIEKPINGFDYKEIDSYKLILKKDNYYEPIVIQDNKDSNYTDLEKQDETDIEIDTKILIDNSNAIITKLTDFLS